MANFAHLTLRFTSAPITLARNAFAVSSLNYLYIPWQSLKGMVQLPRHVGKVIMHVRLLGPVEVLDGTRVLELTRRQKAVLAVLALQPGQVVPVTRLIDGLWGDRLPASPERRCRSRSLGCVRLWVLRRRWW
jgi:hypothetical protein